MTFLRAIEETVVCIATFIIIIFVTTCLFIGGPFLIAWLWMQFLPESLWAFVPIIGYELLLFSFIHWIDHRD